MLTENKQKRRQIKFNWMLDPDSICCVFHQSTQSNTIWSQARVFLLSKDKAESNSDHLSYFVFRHFQYSNRFFPPFYQYDWWKICTGCMCIHACIYNMPKTCKYACHSVCVCVCVCMHVCVHTCVCYIQYLFHPHVTAVAHKRSQSFCQKCRWQVTAKHALIYGSFSETVYHLG